MQAKRVTEKEFSEYDQFVTTHPSGSFLQSRQWGNFQATTGAQIFQYIFTGSDKIIGTAQIFLKKVPGLNQEYIYCPYGPLTVAGQTDVNFFIDQLKQDFPNVMFLRIEPKNNFDLTGEKTIRIQPQDTVINDLSKSTEELLANMHNKTRYNIKVAQKHGVEIWVVENNGNQISDSLELFEQTSQRQKFKNFSLSYYQDLLKHLAPVGIAKLYQAVYQGKVLVAAIMIDFGNTRTYLYGGSSDEYRNVMAPYALHWKAMQDAKQNGLQFYDWWGLRTSEGKISGFTEFKLRFGGEEVTYPKAIDIINKPAWYTIYKVLRKINRIILHLRFK